MMHVSLAEFLGGKEADDAYNKLCDLTGVKWDADRTCRTECVKHGPVFDVLRFSCCGYEWAENRTDKGATEPDPNFCPSCGARVTE